jgi:hypothetical protein
MIETRHPSADHLLNATRTSGEFPALADRSNTLSRDTATGQSANRSAERR